MLEEYRELGQTGKRQRQLMDRNLAVQFWRSGLPCFVKENRVPVTDASCKGWGLPPLSELWGMPTRVTRRVLGMPQPHPICLAPQSVGDVLDIHSINASSAAAF